MMIKKGASLYVKEVQKSFIYFFIDDSLLFCRATMSDLQALQSVLSLYEHASG